MITQVYIRKETITKTKKEFQGPPKEKIYFQDFYMEAKNALDLSKSFYPILFLGKPNYVP